MTKSCFLFSIILMFLSIGSFRPIGCKTTVIGRITDPEDQPVNGAIVRISGLGLSRTLTTEADGTYKFDDVEYGDYMVTVNRDNKMATKAINISYMDNSSCQEVNGDVQLSNWQELSAGSASGGGVSYNAGASKFPVMVRDGEGKVTIAWQDKTLGTWEIYMKRWTGSAWENLGFESASNRGVSNTSGFSKSPSLAIDGSGDAIVAWEDDTTGDTEIYIKKWNGLSWENIGNESASGGGISNNNGLSLFPSLAVENSGKPVVAWEDNTSGNNEIYIKRWTGSGWEELGGSASGGGVSVNSGRSKHPCVAVDGANRPVVAWEDDTSGNYNIYVKRWDGSGWEELGGSASYGGLSDNYGYSARPSITINNSDEIVVAWQDGSSGNVEVYVKRWTGSGWEELGTSASGGGVSDTSGDSCKPSLVVDDSGKPIIVWSDFSSWYGGIYVKRWNGMSWEELESSASGGGISNSSGKSMDPSITLSSSDEVIVAWYDETSGNDEIYIKKWVSD